MLTYLRTGLVVVAAVVLIGCMTTREKMAGVQLGMTKDEVVAVMGPPKVTTAAANSDVETLRYGKYFVRMKGGKVDAYGAAEDYHLSTREK